WWTRPRRRWSFRPCATASSLPRTIRRPTGSTRTSANSASVHRLRRCPVTSVVFEDSEHLGAPPGQREAARVEAAVVGRVEVGAGGEQPLRDLGEALVRR